MLWLDETKKRQKEQLEQTNYKRITSAPSSESEIEEFSNAIVTVAMKMIMIKMIERKNKIIVTTTTIALIITIRKIKIKQK